MLDHASEDSARYARASFFMQEEVVKNFITVLEKPQLVSQLTQRKKKVSLGQLKSYIMRGFKNMIETL